MSHHPRCCGGQGAHLARNAPQSAGALTPLTYPAISNGPRPSLWQKPVGEAGAARIKRQQAGKEPSWRTPYRWVPRRWALVQAHVQSGLGGGGRAGVQELAQYLVDGHEDGIKKVHGSSF